MDKDKAATAHLVDPAASAGVPSPSCARATEASATPGGRAGVSEASTEELILRAAEREFMTKGYAGARTAAIAEAAGVTHAMLHYYFRTKEKLYEKIISDKIGLIGEILLGTASDLRAPLFERVRLMVERHFDFVAAHPELPRFMVVEVFGRQEWNSGLSEMVGSLAPRLADTLQRQIDEYASRGECRRIDARMLLLDILSLNIFPFMAAPMVEGALRSLGLDRGSFYKARRQENVETIIKKLRP